ncbi:MAG: ATPase [Archaeoglobaceae archaeon]
MLLLVVGLLPFDSGKTTVAKRMVEEMREAGIDVGVAKPVSSFNGWYHYEYLLKSIDMKLLVGRDALELHEAAGSTDPIEIESPVTTLLIPPDPEKVGWARWLYTNLGAFRQAAMLRITCSERTEHYLIPENVEVGIESLREEVEELARLTEAKAVEASEIESLLISARRAADECLRLLNHEILVVESFSNVAAPTEASLNADLVLLVAPGKIAVYDGDRYRRAVEIELKDPWLVVTEEVAQLLKPEATVSMRPGKMEVLKTLKKFLSI